MTPHNAQAWVEQYAEAIADQACHLADTAGADDWSAEAKDDVLEAIDTLAGVLSALGPDMAQALAPVAAATAAVRRRLGLTGDESAVAAEGVSGPHILRRPQRRGLGPGFKGIRTEG
ncbi:hypothetical protein R3L02_42330 [Streptomyces scabiei]|uniref:hypothetical protein n=1 Tax=Streptomyces scabiei TaxID=1930 RepID=UPI00298EDA76|nr:hypothetical protein [Streptomyces scabiei]MDW8478387.1 hypothetical protein [Streptomyces scabiei]